MTEQQQRLYCALALLEESDLKAFFRAVRDDPESSVEVEIVNTELDRAVALMDILGPLGPLARHMNDHILELEVLKLQSGRWGISFGFHGPAGRGAYWTMDITVDGRVSDVECMRIWQPRR